MNYSIWIQFVALLVALASLVFTQWRAFKLAQLAESRAQLAETRIEIKLRIFHSLHENDLSEQGIIDKLKLGKPVEVVDEVEVRKSLYEMLKENIILFTDGKYNSLH